MALQQWLISPTSLSTQQVSWRAGPLLTNQLPQFFATYWKGKKTYTYVKGIIDSGICERVVVKIRHFGKRARRFISSEKWSQKQTPCRFSSLSCPLPGVNQSAHARWAGRLLSGASIATWSRGASFFPSKLTWTLLIIKKKHFTLYISYNQSFICIDFY